MKPSAIAVLAICVSLQAYGDSPSPRVPKIFISSSGSFYFKLIPESRHGGLGKGSVYRVEATQDKLLYQTNGWYSFNVLLSSDGTKIAHLGPWASLSSPPKETLAIAFYDRGILMTQFMVSDLLTDLSCVRPSVSHYIWGSGFKLETVWDVERGGNTEQIQIDTYDGQTITFNMSNGKILKRYRMSNRCRGPA